MKPVLKTSKFPISSLPRWPKTQKTMGTRLVSFGHKCGRRLHEKKKKRVGGSLFPIVLFLQWETSASRNMSFDKVSMSVIFLIILFNQHFKPNCNEMIPALHALGSLRINNVTLGTPLGNFTSTYSSPVIGEIQIKTTWNVLDALAWILAEQLLLANKFSKTHNFNPSYSSSSLSIRAYFRLCCVMNPIF